MLSTWCPVPNVTVRFLKALGLLMGVLAHHTQLPLTCCSLQVAHKEVLDLGIKAVPLGIALVPGAHVALALGSALGGGPVCPGLPCGAHIAPHKIPSGPSRN